MIDADQLAGLATIGAARPSPDGRHLAAVVSDGDGRRLVVLERPPLDSLPVSEESSTPTVRLDGATVVLADPAPAGGASFDWLPDGTGLVCSVGDDLWWVATDGSLARSLELGALVGEGRGLDAVAVAPDGHRVAVVVDDRDVTVIRLDGSAIQVVSGGNDFAADPAWSPTGDRLVWHEWNVPNMAWDGSRIVCRAADGSGPYRTIAGGESVSVAQPLWSPDGAWLGFLSDEAGYLNLWLADGDGANPAPAVAEEFEHGPPTWGSGNRSWAWSPDSLAVALTRNEDGFGQLMIHDLGSGWFRPLSKAVHSSLGWAPGCLAAVRSGARTPDQIRVFDSDHLMQRLNDGSEADALGDQVRKVVDNRLSEAMPGEVDPDELADQLTQSLKTSGRFPINRVPRVDVITSAVDVLDRDGLTEPEVVHYAAADGSTLVARRYDPPPQARSRDGAPPMLVWIHGGPTDQWQVTFRPKIAYFCQRGFTVLVPDPRGTTGHGRAHAQALRGRWGEADVEDVAAAMASAGDRGWADPARMAPIGASSGGMTALLLMANHPDLCAAGVAFSPVTDIAGLRHTDHRFEAHYNDSLIGELPDAAGVEILRSPLTLADRIAGPLLVFHGAEDPVVPVGQSEELAAEVTRGGGHVELEILAGEGHSIRRPTNVAAMMKRTERFLIDHLARRPDAS